MLPSHTCEFSFEVSLKAQCSVVERVLFCSLMRQNKETLFQKCLCAIAVVNSSVEMGNVCRPWSLRSISWWLQWSRFQLIWVKSAGALRRSTSQQSFQEGQRFIFHTMYIDEIKCDNASVKLIFGQLERGIERGTVSGWEASNVSVISSFYELIKAPVSPSPITIL